VQNDVPIQFTKMAFVFEFSFYREVPNHISVMCVCVALSVINFVVNAILHGWAFGALKLKPKYTPFALSDADFENQHPTRQRDGDV